MDPVTLIVAAIVAGASAGMTDIVKDAVKASYSALRAKLLERFASPLVRVLLGAVESDPTSVDSKSALKDTLRKENIGAEDELVALAEEVRKADGISIEQVMELAEGAGIWYSGQVVEGVTWQKVRQVQGLGKDAVIVGSPQKTTFGT